MQTKSNGGGRYFLLFVDDYSRMSWVYIMKYKHEVFNCFQRFLASIERQSSYKLKIIRTNKEGEFTSRELNGFCTHMGIKHEYIAPYSPQQNGVVERKNITLVENCRSLLSVSKLPNSFWGEAILIATYLSNISPTQAVLNQTPHEVWFERKPKISHLKVFGCVAYAHILAQSLQKWDRK